MKKLLLSFSFVAFVCFSISAQGPDSLDINQLRVSFQSHGFLFSDTSGLGNFELKDSVNTTIVYAGGLWLSATDSAGNKRAAISEYRGVDFGYGPLCADTARYNDSSFINRYNRVWKLTPAEIQVHRNLVGIGGYIPPAPIADWPAHGDTSKGEPLHLAPFVDLNGNQWYEPMLGDYPLIRGDEAIYIIFNDAHRNRFTRLRASMGIEVHLMAYAYNAPQDTPLHNTIFMNYRIINRGDEHFSDLKTGLWVDFDLGEPNDDLVGSDSAKSYGFCYNATTNDIGPRGFGPNPPAVAMVSLSERFAGASYYLNRGGSGNINANMVGPINDEEYDNYLSNTWRSGVPMIRENPSGCGVVTNGDGYDPVISSPQTKWAFNTNENWYQSPSGAGDMRFLPTYGPSAFSPGTELSYDFAYVVARRKSSTNTCQTLDKLDSSVVRVQDFFTVSQFPCLGCNVSLGETPLLELAIYPNPVNDRLFVEANEAIEELELFDLSGRSIYGQKGEGETVLEINITSTLPPGIYVLKVLSENGAISTKRISKL